ncbi:MAG: dipeptide ABC transporter ATP-binding protein, partial [Gammaproteobacteria bacterium]
QEPMTSLNPVFSIGKQIQEVLHVHFKIREKEGKERVLSLLNEVGLLKPTSLYNAYPHQLSGGMKQRVMIAMALAGEPDLLIADEPTTALDVTTQAQILALLKTLQEKNNMSILFITHDMQVVKKMADRVGVMYAGQLVEIAEREAFLSDPKHPYSKKLFSSLPTIQKRSTFLTVIPGKVPDLTHKIEGCRFANRCQFAWDTCNRVVPDLLPYNNYFVRCHLYTDLGQTRELPKLATPEVISMNEKVVKNSDKTILSIKDLNIHFPIQKGLFKRTVGWIKAVDGVSLDLREGKTLALVGESGSGKTTLAKGILHLLQPTSGSMYIEGKDVFYLPDRDVKSFRHHTQIVFQDPFSAMDPRMLVGDIIAEGMKALDIGKNKAQRFERVEELLHQVGLPVDSIHRYPHEFSGGQRQRICIARTLAVEPKVIVCDEPTSALDVSVQAQILNLLKKLQIESGLTYLFITHNLAVVSYLADDIAVMHQGKIVEYGPAEKILKTPQHVYTKLLLQAAMNEVSRVD